MQRSCEDKVVVVTGGASGIGRAACIEFANQGASIALFDVDDVCAAEVIEMLNQLNCRALYQQVDVSDSQHVERGIGKVIQQFGKIDYAFNNAGIEGKLTTVYSDYSDEDWDNVININLRGVWMCMKYQLQQMLKQKNGAIVNTSSIFGLVAIANSPAYTASKHAVIGLTKAAALAHVKENIRINAVCPGFVHTEMVQRAISSDPNLVLSHIEGQSPIGRLAKPEEIAKAAVWLCSDNASYITGHALVADGGFLAQ